jgi:hypothetical protein
MLIFMIALALGFFVQTSWLAARSMARRPALAVILIAALWLCAPPVLEAVQLGIRAFFPNAIAWREGELLGGALLLFLYIGPFYGFVNARFLQTLHPASIASLSVHFSLLCAARWSELPAAWLMMLALAISGAVLLAVFFAQQLAWFFRMALYGWFLAILGAAAWLEARFFFGQLDLSPEELPGSVTAFFAGMAGLYALFHLWFAVKYALIVLSCTRGEGRALAHEFFSEKFPWAAPRRLALAATLVAQAAISAAGLYFMPEYQELIIALGLILPGPLADRIFSGKAHALESERVEHNRHGG